MQSGRLGVWPRTDKDKKMAPEVPQIDDQSPLLCSECGLEPRRPGQRTGLKCHAAYMKQWRKVNCYPWNTGRRGAARRPDAWKEWISRMCSPLDTAALAISYRRSFRSPLKQFVEIRTRLSDQQEERNKPPELEYLPDTTNEQPLYRPFGGDGGFGGTS